MVLEPETKMLLKALQMEINCYHLVFLPFFPARIYKNYLSKISEKKGINFME